MIGAIYWNSLGATDAWKAKYPLCAAQKLIHSLSISDVILEQSRQAEGRLSRRRFYCPEAERE